MTSLTSCCGREGTHWASVGFRSCLLRFVQWKTGCHFSSIGASNGDQTYGWTGRKFYEFPIESKWCQPFIMKVKVPNTGPHNHKAIFSHCLKWGQGRQRYQDEYFPMSLCSLIIIRNTICLLTIKSVDNMTFWDFSWRGCVWWANIHFSSVVPIFNFLLSPNAFQINNVSKWKFYHSRPGSKWKWWPAVNIKHSRSPSWTGSRGDIWVRPNWCKSQHHRHRHRHHRPHHYHHRHRHPLHPVICHHCHPRHPFRSKPQVTHASSKDTAHDSQ